VRQLPNGPQGAVPSQPRGSVWWETGCLGAVVGLFNVPTTEGGTMQKESPVALVRHHPEMALSATRGRSAHTAVLLTVAKRT
jgi:hypothetical protein